jgi:putative FmdB family regulatory protein
MPTYEWKCGHCGATRTAVMTMTEYGQTKQRCHCGSVMARHFGPDSVPAHLNALAGDSHYQGLRAPDGTDIGSRKKHRDYMKRTGLTTTDDFRETWAKAAEKRQAVLSGEADKAHRVEILKKAVEAQA